VKTTDQSEGCYQPVGSLLVLSGKTARQGP